MTSVPNRESLSCSPFPGDRSGLQRRGSSGTPTWDTEGGPSHRTPPVGTESRDPQSHP